MTEKKKKGAGYYLVGRERERGRYIDGRPLITSWKWLIKVMNIDDTGRNQYSLWQEKFLGGEKTGLSVSQPLSLSLASFSGIYTSLPALFEIQGLEWEERERERERERS